MPVLRIPQNQKWINSNAGEFSGNIIQTFNTNLHRKTGKFSVSDRFYPHTTTDDIVGIQVPTGIVYSNADGTNKIWAVAEKAYKGAYGSVLAADALTNSPTSLSDADIIQWGKTTGGYDTLLITTGTDIARFNYDLSTTAWVNTAGAYWWTDIVANGGVAQTALDSTYPTILLTFGVSPVLFVFNGNYIHSVGTPNSPTNADVSYKRVAFPQNLYVKWARKGNDKIYVGLWDKNNNTVSPSQIAEYDPVQEVVRMIQINEGQQVGFVWNNIPYIVDIRGILRIYNGQSFSEVSRFPISYFDNYTFNVPHRNGVLVLKERVYFNLQSNDVRMPGGIWVFDKNGGEPYLEYTLTKAKSSQNDFGSIQSYGNNWGAIMLENAADLMLVGASVPVNASTSNLGVFSNATVSGVSVSGVRGWFVTPKMISPDQESIFTKLLIRYDPKDYFTGTQTGAILAKYRVTNRSSSLTYLSGTWVTSTTFTTTSVLGIGDEIFITGGQGAGVLAHVSLVSGGPTYTITIDETIPTTPSGTFGFTTDNWVKLSTNAGGSSQTDGTVQYVIFDIPDTAKGDWIQFKIEVRGGWYINELQVGYQKSLEIEK